MKRIGKQDAIKMLQGGAVIREYDWYMLYAGFKVVINECIVGYITRNTFLALRDMLHLDSHSTGYNVYKI